MNKARSIKQNARSDALPNFRNLGVTLRILLICNGLAVLEAVLLANAWGEVPLHMMQIAALLSPVLLTTLLLLWVAQPWLVRLPYLRGALAVNALAVMLTLVTYYYGGDLYHPIGRDSSYFDAARYVLLSIVVCAVLLMYFRWRSQVLSHSLHDARLHVLRARIRPHFLFNTINAVLSIVRAEPKRAETALEDMSDLFRMAMAEPQDLVQLRQEIQLGKQYIALEQLRMGERLQVEWLVDAPDDALIPPLLLQPLLENAVYHGIESLPEGGSIRIELHRSGDELSIKVENPCTVREAVLHTGNRMALQNIRERLELLFDVEARYHVEQGKDFYRVEISLPYVKEGTA
jgi:two-component system sensor histidine kinase AlgZ